MQNKSLMFQVCMVLFMLLVAPVKGLAPFASTEDSHETRKYLLPLKISHIF